MSYNMKLLDKNALLSVLQNGFPVSGYSLQFHQWGESYVVDLDEAKVSFREICLQYSAALDFLREAIFIGGIDGRQYDPSPCGCLFGTLSAGLSVAGLPSFNPERTAMEYAGRTVQRFASDAEMLFLAIEPGCTPNKHPVAALVLMWLDELIEEIRAQAATAE